MQTSDVITTIDMLTEHLVRTNETMLARAEVWTRTNDRVRTITVDGKEAVLIG